QRERRWRLVDHRRIVPTDLIIDYAPDCTRLRVDEAGAQLHGGGLFGRAGSELRIDSSDFAWLKHDVFGGIVLIAARLNCDFVGSGLEKWRFISVRFARDDMPCVTVSGGFRDDNGNLRQRLSGSIRNGSTQSGGLRLSETDGGR